MSSYRVSILLLGISFVPAALFSHESFLPLHEHGEHRHAHGESTHAGHTHAHPDGKAHHHLHLEETAEGRWAVAAGVRYTRYTSEHAHGSLWETGLGADFAVLPWLHLGGDLSYGWFDGPSAKADGWLTPHAHLDVHLPVSGRFEVIAGLEIGFPFADEDLAGEHWEWVPHVELRYDAGPWYAAAGVDFAFTDVAHEHHADESEEEPAKEHENESVAHDEGHVEEHDHSEHTGHLHEIVDPHGERELRYHAAFGVRLIDQKMTAELRFSGVHVISDDTDARNYLRGGLRLTWRVSEAISLSTEGNIPIGHAERNDWQASAAVRVGF
jgi:hypothetical protein